MASKRPIQRDSILANKFHSTSIAFERDAQRVLTQFLSSLSETVEKHNLRQ